MPALCCVKPIDFMLLHLHPAEVSGADSSHVDAFSVITTKHLQPDITNYHAAVTLVSMQQTVTPHVVMQIASSMMQGYSTIPPTANSSSSSRTMTATPDSQTDHQPSSQTPQSFHPMTACSLHHTEYL